MPENPSWIYLFVILVVTLPAILGSLATLLLQIRNFKAVTKLKDDVERGADATDVAAKVAQSAVVEAKKAANLVTEHNSRVTGSLAELKSDNNEIKHMVNGSALAFKREIAKLALTLAEATRLPEHRTAAEEALKEVELAEQRLLEGRANGG